MPDIDKERTSGLLLVDRELETVDKEFVALAKKRRDLLERRLKALDTLLQDRQRTQEELRKLKALLSEEEVSEGGGPPGLRWPVADGEFTAMTVWEAAQEVLRREGRELLSADIAEALKVGGKELGRNASSQVNATLTQKGEIFSSVKLGGKSLWRLREWDRQKDLGLVPASGN